MSGSDAVNSVYELDLPDDVTFRQPADLTFSDHVHRLISSDRIQRAIHRPEPKTSGDSLLDKPMILFQYIIQVRGGPAAASPSQLSRLL